MKRALLALIFFPAAALANDGILGTRAGGGISASSNQGSPVGAMPLVQMVIALAIVGFLVRWALPKVLTKVNKKIVTNMGSAIRIEESAAFAGGNLYVVQAKSKTLLLSVSTAGVSCLADITDSTPNPLDNLPTFHEMVESAPGTPPMAVVEVEVPTKAPNEIEEALARLRRLSG